MPIAPSLRAAQVLAGLAIVALAGACGSGGDPGPGGSPSEVAAGEPAALLLEAASERGHYRIGARPAAPPVEMNRMQDWIVRIERVDESAPIPTGVYFDGGMPSHGHGFVTSPRVTQNLGDGEFLVEGVKFHMPGAWVLQISVTSRTGSDRVTLPVTIEP